MKKLALALAFLMIIPGAAFGLEMMNDSAMDDVTGQAGVSIIADDVQLFLNIERMAWIDSDGFESGLGNPFGVASGSGGAVGISNFQIDVLEINAITNTTVGIGDNTTVNLNLGSTEDGNLNLNWDYSQTTQFAGASIATTSTDAYGDGGDADQAYGNFGAQTLGLDNYDSLAATGVDGTNESFKFSAITIDATSQLPAASEAFSNMSSLGDSNIGGVMIGLPTLEAYIPSLTMTPAFYNLADAGANGAINDVDGTTLTEDLLDGANFGTMEIQGLTFSVLSGWVEIAPH
ncbi:MAG: hypothetical protein U5L07_10775 [Desulfobacterales bacterium]|nr:hypothetical protein [Desulfobacterales bacterium]